MNEQTTYFLNDLRQRGISTQDTITGPLQPSVIIGAEKVVHSLRDIELFAPTHETNTRLFPNEMDRNPIYTIVTITTPEGNSTWQITLPMGALKADFISITYQDSFNPNRVFSEFFQVSDLNTQPDIPFFRLKWIPLSELPKTAKTVRRAYKPDLYDFDLNQQGHEMVKRA